LLIGASILIISTILQKSLIHNLILNILVIIMFLYGSFVFLTYALSLMNISWAVKLTKTNFFREYAQIGDMKGIDIDALKEHLKNS